MIVADFRISYSAFAGCEQLQHLTIPNSVTTIGDAAFSGCRNLVSLTLGSDVESIGKNAFLDCTSLETLVIPNGVQSIGESAFSGCTSLLSLKLGDHVRTIGNKSFLGCDTLSRLTIPDAVEAIGASSFEGCNNLISLNIGKGVASIGDRAFCYCNQLTSLEIPGNVQDVGQEAFKDCGNLRTLQLNECLRSIGVCAFYGNIIEDLDIPNSVQTISDYAFAASGYRTERVRDVISDLTLGKYIGVPMSLKSLSLGSGIQRIGQMAFFNCSSLESLTFAGNSLESIGDAAFLNSCSIVELEIPDNNVSIGEGAFFGCTNLKTLSIEGGNIGENAFGNCSSLETLILKDNVTTIGVRAFYSCENLQHLSLGSGIRTIDTAAFSGCKKLEKVSIPDGTENLGVSAFFDCTSLKELYLGKNVSAIPSSAFANCFNLGKVVIPGSAKGIGDYAFSECQSLVELEIGDNVEIIGGHAFSGCSDLLELKLPTSLLSIGEYAFSNCGKIGSLTIPKGIVMIERHTFSDCYSLRYLYLPEGLQEIKSFAFEGCTNLESVQIPNSVTSISWRAFANCNSLESLKIGNGLKEVQLEAFYGCWELRSLELPNSLTSLGKYAFRGCKSLETLKMGNHIVTIPDGAFADCQNLSSVVLSKRLESIARDAFYNSYSLEELEVGEDLISVGPNAFFGCKELKALSLPKVKDIGESAFKGCAKMEVLSLGDELISIGNSAFEGCSSLVTLKIPDNVATIGQSAFAACQNLQSLILGRGLVPTTSTDGRLLPAIGLGAFKNCHGLECIECKSEQPVDIEEGVFHIDVEYQDEFNIARTIQVLNTHPCLSVPDNSIPNYEAHEVWRQFLMRPVMRMMRYKPLVELDIVIEDENTIEGVTADGASQILVYFDGEVGDEITNCEFHFKVNGEDVGIDDPRVCSGEIRLQKFKFDLFDKGKWGFVYTAPEAYIGEGNEYTLSVEVNALNEVHALVTGLANIRVMRPGVLLIHGFFSDNTCFKELEDYLLVEGGYSKSQVYRVDYRESNTAGFDYNTDTANVVGHAFNILQNKLLEKEHIVSSKYDLVGHSMGGILSRLYAQKVACENVNRIITLDTPHYGSELSNFGVGVLNQMNNARIFYTLITGMSNVSPYALVNSANVLDVIKILQNEIENGRLQAIRDLGVNSNAILELNKQENVQKAKGVPVHAIYSRMTNIEEFAEIDFIYHGDGYRTPKISVGLKKVPLRDAPEIFIRRIFTEEVNTGGVYEFYQETFGGDNDGIVSVVSQLGGFSHDSKCVSKIEDVYRGVGGRNSNAHHCRTNHYIGTMQEIKNLLHLPRNDARFDTDGFKPLSSPMKVKGNMVHTRGIEFKVAEDTSFIKLNVLRDDSARVAIIHVDQSEDVVCNIVYALVGDDEILIANDRTDFCFEIPETFNGELKIQALGRTDYNALVADTTTAEYSNSVRLDFMYYEDKTPVIAHVGDTIRLKVLGEWSNGEEGYLSPAFSSDVDSLLLIDGRMIIANAVGECTLTASYLGLSDDIHITILPNIINFADAEVKRICVENWDTDGDGELTKEEAAAVSDIGLSFTGNHNIISFDELQYFTGLTTIPERAFEEVTNLANIKLPRSVLTIGTYAFTGCSSLTKIDLPEGLKRIDYFAFDGCSRLERISLPNSLERIQAWAFNYCRALKSITITANVVEIGLPIGGWYFGMERMKVEEGNPIFDSRENCNAIIETSTNKLIAGCEATVIPPSVKAIGESAFNCSLISDFAIPEGVEELEDNAFMGCQFNRIELPSSLVHIGLAFSGCSYIKNIVSHIRVPMPIADETFTKEALTAILYVPAGTKTLYETTDGWKKFKTIVEMEAVKGDVNGDGKVTIADVTALVNIILGKNQMQPYLIEVADVNGDSKVTIADVTALVNVILGK